MIHIDLPVPVVLESSLNKVAEILGLDKNDLLLVNNSSVYANVDDDGTVQFLTEQDYHTYREGGGKPFNEYRMGGEGILYIANKLGKEIPYLTAIDLPYSVYIETRHEWEHICNLCCNVEMRAERLKRLLEIDCPDIIIRNEKRILSDAVSCLDDNRAGKEKWGDGDRILSLTDVGWSLIENNWMPWKQRKIDEMDAAIEAEWENAELEEVDDEEEEE